MDKKIEILKRHVNRLHRLYPKECEPFEELEYCNPEVILELCLAMEEYHMFMKQKNKLPSIESSLSTK